MDERNPYAPTRASLERGTASAQAHNAPVWRYGAVLVMAPGASLPHRCVKCNEPADQPTAERKVYWHHPGIYALIILNLLIYLIVALIVRKQAIVSPGLCVQHKKRRRNALLVAWLGVVLGLASFVAAARDTSSDGPALALAGILLILAGLLWGIIVGRVVYAKRIDRAYVRLKGCGVPFLESLPPFEG
jgi:hypothetical protein